MFSFFLSRPRPPGYLVRAPRWLNALRERRARTRVNSAQAALEACASEGAEVDLHTIELDGQRYGALYRNGELICLLPQVQETASPHQVPYSPGR